MIDQDERQNCAIFERIASLTADMYAAARNADWNRLIELETLCRSEFEAAHSGQPLPPHSAEFVRRKSALLRQILADDAEIRRLVEPRMEELAVWLGSAGNTRQLNNAYRPGI
ncbi:MAG: flagellar protein FliT [Burkholderiales bacterium]